MDKYVLPLVVAVTGHRDLVAGEIPAIQEKTRQFFQHLITNYPFRKVRVLTGLAEGADQLVAEVALAMGIELVAVLPMPLQQYKTDFAEAAFETLSGLLAQATDVHELPPVNGAHPEEIGVGGRLRDTQYAQLGVFLCAHCHILLALWDGKYNDMPGGTGQVVRFHHDDEMPGFEAQSQTSQQMLIDDESDLVYHLVCSRDCDDGAPAKGMTPLSTGWFTKDATLPRSNTLPDQHHRIFERSSEFSQDAQVHSQQIADDCYPLIVDALDEASANSVHDINRLFCQADVLAMIFQKKTTRALRVMHGLAFLMGLCFLVYADLHSQRGYLVAFLALFGVSSLLQFVGRRFGWHRKYLDYRALAEGLRVQFYWAVAGVDHGSNTHYAHDNFLQMQDAELGWIRNVMRVAGTRSDAMPRRNAAGLSFVLREWIGGADSGQLAYFRKSIRLREQSNKTTERLGSLSLFASVILVIIFIVSGPRMPDAWTDPLLALMGALLLIYGIREGYSYALAEKELVKQYYFMLRLFGNSRERLDDTNDPALQRHILRALGKSALDEHGEWLMMHRNRSVDDSELWRLGS